MLRSNKLVKVRQEIHKIDLAFMNIFNTPDGKIALEYLIKTYRPERITTDDPFTTGMRARGVEIINDIQRRIEDGVDGKSVR